MSKATVVSIMPIPLTEMKPGIYPGAFVIPAAKLGDIQTLIVGDSNYLLPIPTTHRSVRIGIAAEDVAESLIMDYVTTLLGYGIDQMPGLFWISGAFPKDYVLKNHEREILDARKKQANWFKALVQIADDDWARYHQTKLINDLQRISAECLGLEREWNLRVEDAGTIRCPMCTGFVSAKAVICFQCNFILDEKRYDPSKFAGNKPGQAK